MGWLEDLRKDSLQQAQNEAERIRRVQLANQIAVQRASSRFQQRREAARNFRNISGIGDMADTLRESLRLKSSIRYDELSYFILGNVVLSDQLSEKDEITWLNERGHPKFLVIETTPEGKIVFYHNNALLAALGLSFWIHEAVPWWSTSDCSLGEWMKDRKVLEDKLKKAYERPLSGKYYRRVIYGGSSSSDGPTGQDAVGPG